MIRFCLTILIVTLILGFTSCGKARNRWIGTGGEQVADTPNAVVMRAAMGGATGEYISTYMDIQIAELKQVLQGALVERLGEGIKITFEPGVLFDEGQTFVRLEAHNQLVNLVGILRKYSVSNILVTGYAEQNALESEKGSQAIDRAQAVARYLIGLEVSADRVTTSGLGERRPADGQGMTDGNPVYGHVDIVIFANDKLKKIAAEKTAG